MAKKKTVKKAKKTINSKIKKEVVEKKELKNSTNTFIPPLKMDSTINSTTTKNFILCHVCGTEMSFKVKSNSGQEYECPKCKAKLCISH